MNSFSKPQLTESGIMYFLSNTLNKCNSIQENYYNNIFNIILFLILLVGTILFLTSKYKGKQNERVGK